MKYRFWKGLRFRIWGVFTLLVILVFLLIWFIQAMIIHTGYREDVLREISQTSWGISSAYGSEGFESTLRSVARSGTYYLQIVTEDGELLSSIGSDGQDVEAPQSDIVPEDLFFQLADSDGYYTYFVDDTARGSQWAVQALVLAVWNGNREVLLVCKSMIFVEDLIQILNSRFALIFLIVIVTAVIISLLLAGMLARPLSRLTKQAKQMALGDYTVEFSREGYSEVRYLSETLQMAAEEFSETEKLRRDFIANVSHDMRTPLTVIKAYAEMIQTITGDDPVKRNENLDVIIAEADNLSEFVNDTLELSRLQSRNYKLDLTTFSVAGAVNEVIERFRYLCDNEGYTLAIVIEEGVSITADQGLFKQVVYNLLSNAVKFDTVNKSIEVRAHISGQKVMVSVTDHGKGVAPEDLDSIWNRYYIVDPFGEDNKGTGVGLSIVKEILMLHNADYGVESVVGEGSTFWFAVPADLLRE